MGDTPGDGEAVEPLIEGMWLRTDVRLPKSGAVFNCAVCKSTYDDRISFEIHVKGLKHNKMKMNKIISPGILNKNHPLKHLSQLETALQEDRNPLLGLSYVTEFFHGNGHYECMCNLCDKIFDSIQAAKQHITSSSHMLNFIFFQDRQMYEVLKHNNGDQNHFIREASNLEAAVEGRRVRTKIMEELGNIWVEFQHEGDDPDINMKGHLLSKEYDNVTCLPPLTFVNVDDLLNKISQQFVLSNDLPPSYRIDGFDKIQFMELMGKVEIKSSEDADLCLQLANFLTLTLLKYRMKLIKSLKHIDSSTIRTKLNFLTDEAEGVSEKLLNRG